MADLYSQLCTHLMRTEGALLNPDAVVRPVHLDLKRLEVETNEPFFLDIKRELEYFQATFRPGSCGRREVFYGALYTALLWVTQEKDKEMRKRMLVKTYAWLLANQKRASTSEGAQRPEFLTLPLATIPHRCKHLSTIQVRHLDENRPIEASGSYVQTRRRMLGILRPELTPFARPKEDRIDVSSSLMKKLTEERRAQMRTLREFMESKQALRTISRQKTKAEREVQSRVASSFNFAWSPDVAYRRKPSQRPPTVIKCMTGPLSTPSPTLRPKSRSKVATESIAFELDRASLTSEVSFSSQAESPSFMSDLAHIKYRLSQAKVQISYKTLAGGLAPPKPTMRVDLPEGGEMLTSNPFLQITKAKGRKARQTSVQVS